MATFTGIREAAARRGSRLIDHFTGQPAGARRTGARAENPRANRLRWSAPLALVLGLALGEARADDRPTFPQIAPDSLELVPYQSSGYRIKFISTDENPPADFEQPGFDDTDFASAAGAFGSSGRCPLQSTVATDWPTHAQLLIRRLVSIPQGATNLRVMVSVDNDIVGVFFNGISIADSILHDDCPILDEFRLDVPPDLVQPGANLVAFQILDRGIESFFDARILADLTPDQLISQLDKTVIIGQAPLIPVSDIFVDSNVVVPGEQSNTAIRYVVTGTDQVGEISIQQDAGDDLTVAFDINGKRMGLATDTPETKSIWRSIDTTRGLIRLELGLLSANAALTQQFVLDRLFQSLSASPDLSCRTRCDVAAAKASRIVSLLADFLQGGSDSADIVREGSLTSVGAADALGFFGTAAEIAARSRVRQRRQRCLATCAPDLTPVAGECSAFIDVRRQLVQFHVEIGVQNTAAVNAPTSVTTIEFPDFGGIEAIDVPTPRIGPHSLVALQSIVVPQDCARDLHCKVRITADSDDTLDEVEEANNSIDTMCPL